MYIHVHTCTHAHIHVHRCDVENTPALIKCLAALKLGESRPDGISEEIWLRASRDMEVANSRVKTCVYAWRSPTHTYMYMHIHRSPTHVSRTSTTASSPTVRASSPSSCWTARAAYPRLG